MSGAPSQPPRASSATRRWIVGGVLATCAVILLGVGIGVTASQTTTGDENDSGRGDSASASPTVSPDGTARPSATPSAQPDPTRIGFIGDSWSSGTGTDGGPEAGYAALAAKELGWEYQIFAGGGTGYVQDNPATGDGAFGDRVDDLIAFAPDVVVVQGSSNDSQYAADDIEAAAEQVFTTIRRALPQSTIYAFGVLDSPAADDAILATSRAGVSQAATDTSAIYIDPNDDEWLDLGTDFADGYHPDAEGHRKVAQQLALQLDPGLAG